ncbi:MAG: hypothetical protein DMG72_22965 [Acidobacteria bacterium]|nr:MAG: hypothetical protein DMG72_22965 [Acidobacteriota bacterium]
MPPYPTGLRAAGLRLLAFLLPSTQAGFQHGWIFDSNILWREPYPLLTLLASSSQKMRLDTCY